MKSKQKQPYIPFYVGDYLTDTRILPLNVRGAWVDLILYMWNNEPKGEIVGTYEEFARLVGCSIEEMKFCIDLLNQKKTFDCEFLANNHMKLTSRKIKKIVLLSEKRKNSGKMGGNPNLVNQSILFASEAALPKDKQKPEYENEYDNEDNNNNNTEVGGVGDFEDIRNTFEKFWKDYDKNIARLSCEKLWIHLTPQERIDILDYVPKYVLSQPDKQFRVHPAKFLEDKMWFNEIIQPKLNGHSKKPTKADVDASLRKKLSR